jgi:glycosyltransferase involved in cell wall biosynthesis
VAVIPGGHLVQMKQTARALAALGCQVTESIDRNPSLADVDIVHGFGLGVDEVRRCRQLGLPVVISTIHWDLQYLSDGPPSTPTLRSLGGRLVRSGRFASASMRGRGQLANACMVELRNELQEIAILASADLLLPNAAGEQKSLETDLHISTPCRVVPNGVDPERFSPGQGSFAARDRVLYVGRAEPHKNQLGLLEALRNSGLPLTLAYVPHQDHGDYLERCREAADGWAQFVEDPAPDELVELYRAARVHILPSWFETTGLVSLEAGLCGCNVVSTNRGHAKEYLSDLAWYCDPARPESIRNAVAQAWQSPSRPALRERILNSYTWAHAARATLAAYQDALEMHRGVDKHQH